MPHTQFSRRFLLAVRIGDADINLLQSVLILDILTVNGFMSFVNVMDLAVVARFYHIRGYSMKSVCIFAFREAFTTYGVMSESRSLAKFYGRISGRIAVVDDQLILVRQYVPNGQVIPKGVAHFRSLLMHFYIFAVLVLIVTIPGVRAVLGQVVR